MNKQPKTISVGLFGYGSFGKLVARHLSRYFPVLIYHPHPQAAEKLPQHCRRATIKQAASCSVVILSVNLAQFEGLLKQIRPFIQPGALVCDVTSVKVKPVQLMKRGLPKHAQILATHPLFGPESAGGKNVRGHKIIIHRVRVNKPVVIENFLSKTLGLRVIHMDPITHDKKMALVHGLTFFLARGLIKMNLPDDGLSAPSYRKLLSLAELEQHHSPQLFQTIEAGNPYTATVRKRIIKNLQQLHRQTLQD